MVVILCAGLFFYEREVWLCLLQCSDIMFSGFHYEMDIGPAHIAPDCSLNRNYMALWSGGS